LALAMFFVLTHPLKPRPFKTTTFRHTLKPRPFTATTFQQLLTPHRFLACFLPCGFDLRCEVAALSILQLIGLPHRNGAMGQQANCTPRS
jgi:hypothetical protein